MFSQRTDYTTQPNDLSKRLHKSCGIYTVSTKNALLSTF